MRKNNRGNRCIVKGCSEWACRDNFRCERHSWVYYAPHLLKSIRDYMKTPCRLEQELFATEPHEDLFI